jgi:hypothetical protein
MIQGVADDHASLLVDNYAPKRVAEVAVVAALLPSDTHVRAVGASQHMDAMRPVFDDNHVDAAVKSEA